MGRRARRAGLIALGLVGFGVIGLAATLGGHPATIAEAPAVAATPARANEPAPDLEIHEWGTFLGMSGSDGTPLEGMYHEEHALPPFVHSRGRDQLRLPSMFLKGETPVIYFYTERPQSVRVGVGFPKGIWTHWYPQAVAVRPPLADRALAPEQLRNGRICWQLDVLPAKQVEEARKAGRPGAPTPPATSRDALWNFSREVDAAYVKVTDEFRGTKQPEHERFLFYRGLGEAHLPLAMAARDMGTLTLDQDATVGEGVNHVFVLRVERGQAAYRYVPRLGPGESLSGVIPSDGELTPLDDCTRRIADDLAGRLTESGLFAKEAQAMVNTWKTSYFQADGIRVLFVLPRRWTDAFIPMTVVPEPKRVVRVMVGRLELLSAERERLAEEAVRGLSDPDEARRMQAFATLRAQGRYVEPIVRRVLRTSKDPRVQTLARRLLTADEVTELRAAVHDAATGTMLNEDPTLLRALLARLLREIGLDREARAESVGLLNALGKDEGCEPGNPLGEIRAAALEASGLDASAATLYEECIRQRVGLVKSGPLDGFRDWWVGRAYARCRARAGDLELTASFLEAQLALGCPGPFTPDVRLARVLLAHLRAAQGRQAESDALWLVASRDGC